MAIFDFRDFSIKGDRRWSSASRWTSFAPPVVFALFLLAIIEIVVGVVWVVSIQSAANNLSFGQVIQPIIVPGLSFFNTVPSLHLHVLARSNKPLLAMYFSAIMGTIYLASAIVFLPPCVGSNAPEASGASGFNGANRSSYSQTECPDGSRRDVWIVMIVFQFFSALGYFVHFAMAWKVKRVVDRRELDEREGRVLVEIDPIEKARREEEARARWREIGDL